MNATKKCLLRFEFKGFYRILSRQAFFLLTAKETKLPARNFFIQVSNWAWSVPSQKIDHAGLRAERRNGGLALPGGHGDRISPSFFKKIIHSLLPPCSPA